MTYVPADDRYDNRMPYRRCGRSGVRLPAVSLGLWHNFGHDRALDEVDGVLDGLLDEQATVVVEERDEGDAGAGEEGSGHGTKRYARIGT